MIYNIEKMSRFQELIAQKATRRGEEILREAEELEKEAQEEIRSSVLDYSFHIVQAGVAEVEANATTELSQKTVELRRQLFLKREEYARTVFAQVRCDLIDFSRTPAYRDFLKSLAKKLGEEYSFSEGILELREADKELSGEIQKAYGKSCTVRINPDIVVGGLRLLEESKGYIVDETLENRLNNQKEWFRANSGLSVI